MTEDQILKFAIDQEYDDIKYIGKWKEYEVYEPLFDYEGISYVGLPLIILVKDDTIRMSTPDEAFEYLDDTN
jgi:hypothetical protein